MNETIVVAFIAVFGSAFTFWLTKRNELAVQLRNEKLNHYKVLISAISGLAGDGTDKADANKKFALAVNTIALAAPQDVIKALMAFHDEIKVSNPNKSPECHDKLLQELLLTIRKDIGLAKGDDRETFNFRLINSGTESRTSL